MVLMSSISATDVENEWLVTFTKDDGTDEQLTVSGLDAHEATIAAGELLISLNAS